MRFRGRKIVGLSAGLVEVIANIDVFGVLRFALSARSLTSLPREPLAMTLDVRGI